MDAAEVVRRSPKVELHLHLDGALDYQTLLEAVQRPEVRDSLPVSRTCPWTDPETGKQPIVRPREELGGCRTIDELKAQVTSRAEVGLFPLLEVFYRYLPVPMNHHDLLELFAFRLMAFQSQSNILYSEVRFSPHEFFPEADKANPPPGLAKSIVERVAAGLARGCEEFGVEARMILCCINFSPHWSKDVVETALACRDLGVVGVDIASGEDHFCTPAMLAQHKAAMDLAHSQGLKITVHAGECGPAANVEAAIDAYHAARIGHAYHALEDEALTQRLKRDGIHLECCPTSSLLTKAASTDADGSMASHPIKQFVRQGQSVSINTDDPRVFDIDLRDEFSTAVQRIGLSVADLHRCTLNAIDAAFCDEDCKRRLRQRVQAWYATHTNVDSHSSCAAAIEPTSSATSWSSSRTVFLLMAGAIGVAAAVVTVQARFRRL